MWRLAGNLASLVAIVGVSATDLVADRWKSWAALAICLLCAGYVAWLARKAFDTFSKLHYPEGYLCISSFFRYTTLDGKNFVHETHRHIQIKTAFEKRFTHKFLWTGSKAPIVTSDLQTVSAVEPVAGENTKRVTLTFPRVRMFNEAEVVQLRMDIDDSDEIAQTYLRQRVDQPIRLIHFRVELLHASAKYFAQSALVTRCSTALDHAIPEELKRVPFDAVTKSFSHQIIDPDPGYQYQLSWPRPALQRKNTHTRNGLAEREAEGCG
jgi:hypothetical protein